MLLNIHVKNMALIQELDVDLGAGLNILTGETGAGKSIVIGAVNVALGTQSFKGFAREDAGYALVELIFSIENDKVRQRLKELEVSCEDDQVIISRRLSGGRSLSKINGETVPVAKIRQVAEILIDIHGQHEHQSLLYARNHLLILDEFAGAELTLPKQTHEQLYRQYQQLKKELAESEMDETARKKEADFLAFEIDEIEAAQLTDGEDDQLEKQYRRMAAGQKIQAAAAEAYQLTGYDAAGAGESTGKALQNLSGVISYDEVVNDLYEQLTQIESLLNDFNRELADYLADIVFEESEFQTMEERLNTINRLKEKYGRTISEIHEYQAQKAERLRVLREYDTYRENLQQKFRLQKDKLYQSAGEISRIRRRFAAILEKEIKQGMQDLNFAEVKFEIVFHPIEEPGPNGADEICFMLSTNPGEAVRPLSEVASGGELSRIMLAMKTVMAEKDEVGTLIFDEIDVGISGRTAQKVSEKMGLIAGQHQVICITHLAQIAAMADYHYLIEKNVGPNQTNTSIYRLDQEQSIEELARILGGVKITDTVRENAREMKDMAGSTKKY